MSLNGSTTFLLAPWRAHLKPFRPHNKQVYAQKRLTKRFGVCIVSVHCLFRLGGLERSQDDLVSSDEGYQRHEDA